MFKYCYKCKVDFFEDCVYNFHQKEKNHYHNHWDVCIPVNEKNHKYLEHFNSKILSFWLYCQENVYEKYSTTKHSRHNKINFTDLENDINHHREIIQVNNKFLSDNIKFNQIVLNCYEFFKIIISITKV